MKKNDIIRAWKDPEFRASLSQTELNMLDGHPAGLPELTDDQLSEVSGGSGGGSNNSCCGSSLMSCCKLF